MIQGVYGLHHSIYDEISYTNHNMVSKLNIIKYIIETNIFKGNLKIHFNVFNENKLPQYMPIERYAS